MDRPTVYIETYGCQMNVSDSELMLGALASAGYEHVEKPDGADVILVNTCAIRDHAEQRVVGRLGELKRHMKRDSIMGVTGCMAQRLGPQLLDKAKHVSLVIGPDGYRALPALVDGARRETRTVVAEGMSEVVLLGQTVNSYNDGTHDFADLLRAVGDVPGVRRVRFTSPHPNDFTDRVIGAMADVGAVCEHVHLPMQSGSSRVLKRMLRRYSREGYMEGVERIRAAIPGVPLTTDIIVGFPGATPEQFQETLTPL